MFVLLQLAKSVLQLMGSSAKKTQLEELLMSGNYKVNFMTYNWALNSK